MSEIIREGEAAAFETLMLKEQENTKTDLIEIIKRQAEKINSLEKQLATANSDNKKLRESLFRQTSDSYKYD